MNIFYCTKFHSEMTDNNFYFLSTSLENLKKVNAAFYEMLKDEDYVSFNNLVSSLQIIKLYDGEDEILESNIVNTDYTCLTQNDKSYIISSLKNNSFRF